MTSRQIAFQDMLLLSYPAQATQHHLRTNGSRPARQGSRQLIRTQAGYRWSAGTSSKRLREGLLDNVDPAAPADAADSGWRPVTVPQPAGSAAGPTSNGSGGAAGAWPQQSSRPEAPQGSPAAPDRPGPTSREEVPVSNTRSSSSGSSNSGSNGTRPADVGGWGVGPNPLPDDWGWPQSRRDGSTGTGAWAGLSGAGRRASTAAPGASAPGSGGEVDGAAGAPQEAWEAAEEVQWDAEEGPDVVELRPQEAAAVVPGAPTADQIAYCSGGGLELWQRLGWSLLATLVTLKAAALAAGSLTFPLWYPSLRAALRNRAARGKYRRVGLWRVSVLDVEVDARMEPRFREPGRAPAGPQGRTLRLLVGDASGARSEVAVPYKQQYDMIRAGEPAELLVLSNSRGFSSFKALKEVYLPECGVWVSDYPFLNRTAFLDLSLEIERERQAHMAAP